MYRKYIKRFLDIVLSFFSILILSPVYILISFFVLVKMGRPILFSQDRIGKDEKIFKLYKFRSMISDVEKDGKKLTDKERLTRFGILLRSSSMDELPEIFMILKGDMSIIGPRPQPSFYLPYYKSEERIAHKVRGGLLPPDSLCKEVQCDWETQLKYEVYYAEHVSFSLDVKILLCTFIILFKRIKYNYGADNRPMLNEYRSNLVSKEEIKKWKEKGIEVKWKNI